jgi:hypothetical protein
MARRKGVTKDIAALHALASSQRAPLPAPVETEKPAADPLAELAGDAKL